MSIPTTNVKGIYSVKWMNPAYIGPILTIRRSSDNVTSDFYVSEDGELIGTSYGGFGTLLTTWLGVSTAYVTKWWDQSTFGNHATQTTTSKQPIFNNTTKSIDFVSSSQQMFNLPDNTVPSGNTNYSVIIKHGTVSASSGFLGSGTTSTNNQNSFALNGTTYNNYWGGDNNTLTGAYAENNMVTWKYDGINRTINVNGGNVVNISSTGRNSATTNNFIGLGDVSNNNYLNGQLFFVYVYQLNFNLINTLYYILFDVNYFFQETFGSLSWQLAKCCLD